MNGSNHNDDSIHALSQLLSGQLNADARQRLKARLSNPGSDLRILINGLNDLPTSMLAVAIDNATAVPFGAMDWPVDESFAASQLVDHLQARVRACLDNDVPVHQIDNRSLIEHAYRHVFGTRQVDSSVTLSFFVAAGGALAEVLATIAREKAATPEDADDVSSSQSAEQDTVAAAQTTLAESINRPQRVLAHVRRLDALRSADTQLATVYTLTTLSGRTDHEVAELLNLPLAEVAEAIEIAEVEVCLDD